METPTTRNRLRPSHVPTPKMSERKKSLFSSTSKQPNDIHSNNRMKPEMHILDGMMPLDFESAIHVQTSLKSCLRPKVKKLSGSVTDILKSNDRIPLSVLCNSNTATEIRHSPRVKKSPKRYSPTRSPVVLKTPSPSSGKQNCLDEDLGDLLKDTLHLRSRRGPKVRRDSDDNVTDEEISEMMSPLSHKRHQQKSSQSPNNSPKAKQPKIDPPSSTTTPTSSRKSGDPNSNTDSPSTNKNYITSIEQFSIPAKTFYSSHNKSPNTSPKSTKARFSLPLLNQAKSSLQSSGKKSKYKPRNDVRLAKHVSHKVPRPKFKPTPQTVDTILQSLNGEKFKKLLENRMYKKKAEEVHKIMKSNANPIEKSRPLNTNGDANADDDLFSDCEEDDQMDVAEPQAERCESRTSTVCDDDELEEEEENAPIRRKFFKSRNKTSRNAFTINNVRGTVTKGRVSLLPMPDARGRKRSTGLTKTKLDFTNEQAAVNDIIEWLGDDPPLGNTPPATVSNDIPTTLHEDEFLEFRKRIPYKATDPIAIEQQELLLDFLISYNICNERNFEIFIMDPENHKEEAAKIIDSLITVAPTKDSSLESGKDEEDMMSEMSESIVLNLTDSQEANTFRQRLPYNTNDPVVAEQQKTLLEFLIKNQICNEENFRIFIAEPEKHRDKASKILQNYMVPSNIDIPNEPRTVLQNHVNNCMGIDPFSVAAELPSSNVADITFETSHTTLESMMSDDDDSQWRPLSPTIPLQQPQEEDTENRSNNQNDPKLFPIFYSAKVKPINTQSTRKKSPKSFLGGFGLNQYQIDAGQKEFGAKQCTKCGLVYTVHEPEEEKLHAIYHRSLNILKFKGWIDEDIVMNLPEWGPGGRIIRLTHNVHPKRMERIVDILNIIDKELGIVSDMVPTPFVAFLAVRRNEIVGFSLVQPIKSANRYVCLNGVDCCTEESFEAKCGIMRIWVSPLNRCQGIASKLIEVIRTSTFPGVELPMSDVAFSSPTHDGILFAQKITKRKDFLMYQSF